MRWEQILKNNSVLNSTIIKSPGLFSIFPFCITWVLRGRHTLPARYQADASVSPSPVGITPIFRRQSVHEQSFIQPELRDTYIHLFCPPSPPKPLLSDFPKLTLAPFLSLGLILLSWRNANTHSSQPSMCVINHPLPPSPLSTVSPRQANCGHVLSESLVFWTH